VPLDNKEFCVIPNKVSLSFLRASRSRMRVSRKNGSSRTLDATFWGLVQEIEIDRTPVVATRERKLAAPEQMTCTPSAAQEVPFFASLLQMVLHEVQQLRKE